jgi:hypothetical protein
MAGEAVDFTMSRRFPTVVVAVHDVTGIAKSRLARNNNHSRTERWYYYCQYHQYPDKPSQLHKYVYYRRKHYFCFFQHCIFQINTTALNNFLSKTR